MHLNFHYFILKIFRNIINIQIKIFKYLVLVLIMNIKQLHL